MPKSVNAMTSFVARSIDPDHAVLGIHFHGDVEQPVDALAEIGGDAIDGCHTVNFVDVHVRPRSPGLPLLLGASSTEAVHQAGARDGQRCEPGHRRAKPADQRRSFSPSR